MDARKTLEEVTIFYSKSRDFNGIPVTELYRRLGLSWFEFRGLLNDLIREDKINLTFSSVFVNPHILALPSLEKDKQIEKLQSEDPEGICAYPSENVVWSTLDIRSYDDRPFTKRLLLTEPQLLPIYFDLSVLEQYYADPRYRFRFYDYGGSISISDSCYESPQTAERDKVFIQSFGLGYTSEEERVVVVFLRYLKYLSPEHQQIWNADWTAPLYLDRRG